MSVNEKMTAIADAIRDKTGGTEKLGLDAMANGVGEVYAKGEADATAKAEAHNAAILTDCNAVLADKGVETADTLEQVPQRIGEIDYLPNPLLYAARTANLYRNAVFPNGYELRVTSVNHQGDMENMFNATTGIRKITLELPSGIAYNVYNFARQSSVEEIILPDGIHFTSWNYFAYLCSNLKRVIGKIDCSGHAPNNNNSFTNCSNLEEVYFMPGTIDYSISLSNSPKLIAESIQSIVDGLADLTGGTAQKLTLHATVGAKLTEVQKATVTAKNWTLVY